MNATGSGVIPEERKAWSELAKAQQELHAAYVNRRPMDAELAALNIERAKRKLRELGVRDAA